MTSLQTVDLHTVIRTSLMFVSTSGLEVSVVVDELSSLSTRWSFSSSP